MTHIRRLRCTAADCKFPPFASPQALKIHTAKYHSHSLPPKSIRGIQVSSNTTGSFVYQRISPDTRQTKSLPQNAGQKAQEGRAKRKFPVGNDENPSSHKLSSADSSTTSKPSSSSTTEYPPLNYCSFGGCSTLTDGSYNSLCLKHLRQSLTFDEKGPDSQSTESAPSTFRTIVETSEEDLMPPVEPSFGRNVIPLEVLADENSEQMVKPQLLEGIDVYVTSTLTTGQAQSSTSTTPVAEPGLSPSGSLLPSTLGITIGKTEEDLDDEGEERILPSGKLLGGREYRCQTFPGPTQKGDLYMLETDCVRMLGHHYTRFAQGSGQLPILLLKSAGSKSYLMAQNILHNAQIYDEIFVVKARNVFRQFGHLAIEDGRPVHDDYWVADARDQLKANIIQQIESNLSENDQIMKRFGIVGGRSVVQTAALLFEWHLDAKATVYGGIENLPDGEITKMRVNVLTHLQDKYNF